MTFAPGDAARSWGVLGVPSSAAAHWPGVDKAPAALRGAGLIERVRAADPDAVDFGDAPVGRWRSRREGRGANNVRAVVQGLEAARSLIGRVVDGGRMPLVIGGECTVTVAVVSALRERGLDVGVVYIDGGQDLMTPAGSPDEPILDAMGVAHMLDLPGADRELAGIGPVRPLLTASNVVFYGFSDDEEDEDGLVASPRFPAAAVTADPEGTAARAAAAVEGERFVVHVDVDVLDFLAAPLADIAIFGRGLTLDVLERAMCPLVGDPRCAALVVVEVNPDHDPDGRATASLVDMLGRVLATRPRR